MSVGEVLFSSVQAKRIQGKDCTLSLSVGAVNYSGQVGNLTGVSFYTGVDMAAMIASPPPLESLPRRERHWLAGYLEIKDWVDNLKPSRRQLIKLNPSPRSYTYWPAIPRHLAPAASAFFGRPRLGKVRHVGKLAGPMVVKLSRLSGDSQYTVEETLCSYTILNHPTPAQWRRIWTGE